MYRGPIYKWFSHRLDSMEIEVCSHFRFLKLIHTISSICQENIWGAAKMATNELDKYEFVEFQLRLKCFH